MTTLFISYTREDSSFHDDLAAALTERGIRTWVDEENIAAAVPWRTEIDHGIEESEALISVVSPDSASSEICREEIRYAEQLGKRILPVVYREARDTIPEIADRNWIFWRTDDERESALEKIDEALTVDPEWAKEHTRMLTGALEWERRESDRSRLLSGQALAAAEMALTVDRPRDQPQATPMMREFVRSSRTAATRRQRRTIALAFGVAAVSIALALIAFAQFRRANAERERAEEELRIATSRALSAQALQLGEFGNTTTGLLLAVEGASLADTDEARDALLSLLPAAEVDRLRSPERPDAAVDRVESPDGRFEVSDDGRTLRDLSTGESQTLVDDPDPQAVFLRDAVFSPDASRLVVTNLGDSRFDVYDLGGGLPAPVLFQRQGPDAEPVVGAALDSSNNLVAVSVVEIDTGELSGEAEGLTVSIWNDTGTEVLIAEAEGTLDGDFDLTEAMVRIGEHDLAALVTRWGEAQLFSARTALLIGRTFPVQCTPDCIESTTADARVSNASFGPATLATIDSAGSAREFDVGIDRWIQLACGSTDERLTTAQWERFVGTEIEYAPVC